MRADAFTLAGMFYALILDNRRGCISWFSEVVHAGNISLYLRADKKPVGGYWRIDATIRKTSHLANSSKGTRAPSGQNECRTRTNYHLRFR